MTFKNVSGVLPNAVAFTGNFASPYPAGTSRGDFLGGRGHQLAIGQNVFNSPEQFSVAFGGHGVVVTNNTQSTWAEGEPYALSLNEMGSTAGWPSASGQPMPRIKPWPVVYLNLGSPKAENEEGLRVAAAIEAAGEVALLQTSFDVPRNITFHSDGAENEVVFTVTSTDEYGQKVAEDVIGADHGRKAHLNNIAVSASGPSDGAIKIGWGDALGLPCFVASDEVILKQLQDGEEGPAGLLIGGDGEAATADTGDVRGTYEPEPVPDGIMAYGLLVCIPDPGYQGVSQFAG